MGQIGLRMQPPPADLPEDVHAEILVRLPAETVLRFRSVCKAWRRITSDPGFLAAHARRRPAQVVMYTYLDSTGCKNRPLGYAVDIALDVFPVSGEEEDGACRRRRRRRRRRLIRYPKFVTTADRPERWRDGMPMHCLLLGSCDGVLLFRKELGFYLLCNPITRQWAELPRLPEQTYGGVRVGEYGFYFHRPSGEFRLLLCGSLAFAGGQITQTAWCVLSTGAAEPRHLDPHDADDQLVLNQGGVMAVAPLALHDRLHWPPRRDRAVFGATEMVAFDTLSEKFRVMAGPPAATTTWGLPLMMKLFAMDGLLAAADFGKAEHVDLWFLADYGAGRWERRHRVAARICQDPAGCWLLATAAASDDKGNVMLGNHCSLSVYNVRTETVRAVGHVATRDNNVLVSRHVFRESLVQHPGFRPRSSTDGSLPLIHFWS